MSGFLESFLEGVLDAEKMGLQRDIFGECWRS